MLEQRLEILKAFYIPRNLLKSGPFQGLENIALCMLNRNRFIISISQWFHLYRGYWWEAEQEFPCSHWLFRVKSSFVSIGVCLLQWLTFRWVQSDAEGKKKSTFGEWDKGCLGTCHGAGKLHKENYKDSREQNNFMKEGKMRMTSHEGFKREEA